MRRMTLFLFGVIVSIEVIAAPSGDSARGKALLEANCGGCHDASVYSRKDRHVQSLEALRTQVRNCGEAAKKSFSETDQQNLVKYLNDTYYHFK